MSIEVKVPNLPESVADATVVAWHKQAGDTVQRDENLVDLETDKVVLEVPAPATGVLKEIRIADGTTVTSGEILAILEEGAGAAAEPAAPAASAATEQSAAAATSAPSADASKLSPSVRRLVEEHGVDPAQLTGTGNNGRITKADVMAAVSGGAAKAPPAGTAPAGGAAAPAKAVTTPAPAGGRGEQRVPMTRMRTRIAERMVEAQSAAAMLTSFNEVDLTEVKALRARYRDKFEKEHGARLGFMSFFVRASVAALRKFPVVNASVEGNDIIYHDYCDVGIAVSTPRGLVVPVLRNAEGMSFAQIEGGINEYATRAREGQIALEDITGGTFTITNGGVFGSLLSTPILNPPQSAILGMHNIVDRPMVVNGKIKARPMMYIALTYDHRIIDGKDAVQFLVHVKESLEDPARLLLQV